MCCRPFLDRKSIQSLCALSDALVQVGLHHAFRAMRNTARRPARRLVFFVTQLQDPPRSTGWFFSVGQRLQCGRHATHGTQVDALGISQWGELEFGYPSSSKRVTLRTTPTNLSFLVKLPRPKAGAVWDALSQSTASATELDFKTIFEPKGGNRLSRTFRQP
jgi:hypothetical protein